MVEHLYKRHVIIKYPRTPHLAGSRLQPGDEDLSQRPFTDGLYVKDESAGRVIGRYKWVRAGFAQALLDSGSHWADRPIVPNGLADPAVMYAM